MTLAISVLRIKGREPFGVAQKYTPVETIHIPTGLRLRLNGAGGLADGRSSGLTSHLHFTGACVVQREVVEMQAQLRRWRVSILSHAAACTSVVCFYSRNKTTVRFQLWFK